MHPKFIFRLDPNTVGIRTANQCQYLDSLAQLTLPRVEVSNSAVYHSLVQIERIGFTNGFDDGQTNGKMTALLGGEYSGDLNTGLVWYSNGQKQSTNQMVCYLNGGLNTEPFQPVI